LSIQRAAASERYHLSLEEMLHNEKQADIRQEEDFIREGEEATHRVSRIFLLTAEILYGMLCFLSFEINFKNK